MKQHTAAEGWTVTACSHLGPAQWAHVVGPAELLGVLHGSVHRGLLGFGGGNHDDSGVPEPDVFVALRDEFQDALLGGGSGFRHLDSGGVAEIPDQRRELFPVAVEEAPVTSAGPRSHN